MAVRAHRSELAGLPPHGRRWRWEDVVGTDDELVDPATAYAVINLIDQHADGSYETSKRLEEYLAEKWGVECNGTVTPPGQATLPGTGTDAVGPAADPVRTLATDGGDDRQSVVDAPGWQVTLDGRRADRGALRARRGRERRTTVERIESMRRSVGDCQTVLGAFTSSRRVGGFERSCGDVYSGPSPSSA
jgi:hypothetical protein